MRYRLSPALLRILRRGLGVRVDVEDAANAGAVVASCLSQRGDRTVGAATLRPARERLRRVATHARSELGLALIALGVKWPMVDGRANGEVTEDGEEEDGVEERRRGKRRGR